MNIFAAAVVVPWVWKQLYFFVFSQQVFRKADVSINPNNVKQTVILFKVGASSFFLTVLLVYLSVLFPFIFILFFNF